MTTDAPRPTGLIGYTRHRTQCPDGQFDYIISRRACVTRADGSGGESEVAPQLVDGPHVFTSFESFLSDGRAVITRGWCDPDNAAWEHEHRTFRMTPEGWQLDLCLVDLDTGDAVNLSAVERCSHYQHGLVELAGQDRFGFVAMVGDNMQPFTMKPDGSDKQHVGDDGAFVYGLSASPDGKRIAYHRSYKLFVANADGSETREVDTGCPFNFCPTWSPDGEWLMLVAGKHMDSHPYLVRPDGSECRKLFDRGAYTGVADPIDPPDFHSAGSDVPKWSADGGSIFCTAQVGASVELFRVSVEGVAHRLTSSAPLAYHHHPAVSPCGQWVSFGRSFYRDRQLWVSRVDGSDMYPLTRFPFGTGAMHTHWPKA